MDIVDKQSYHYTGNKMYDKQSYHYTGNKI